MGNGEEDVLKLVGEALYGQQWQAPLSRDLQVTDWTVRNWANGSFRPPELPDKLLVLLRARADRLE